MAKVCDLLMLLAFREIRVVAGHNGLERKVEHVTVMEVPDTKRWLKGNDFLITSFYSARENEEKQCSLIQAADECGVPLLEIPFEMPYIDIVIHVMNKIFEEEGSTAILEKYVKDILYENYKDEILMEERGRLFGFEVKKNYYMAINISFRKKYVPSETEKRALRSLGQYIQQYVETSDIPPIDMSENVQVGLERAARRAQVGSRKMISGAGHDTMSFASLCDTGMIFIPCAKGISHNRTEFASIVHICDGAKVIYEYLKEI